MADAKLDWDDRIKEALAKRAEEKANLGVTGQTCSKSCDSDVRMLIWRGTVGWYVAHEKLGPE